MWLQAGDQDGTNWKKYYREDFRPDKIGALMDVNPTGEIVLIRVKKFREWDGLKKAFKIFVSALSDSIPVLIVDGDGTHRAIGNAIFIWFEKAGYEASAIINGEFGRDTFDDTEEGRKGLYQHLVNSKVNKIVVKKQ